MTITTIAHSIKNYDDDGGTEDAIAPNDTEKDDETSRKIIGSR